MNIFALSADPVQAAQWHCDQHINKMILETAQILSTAARTHIASEVWISELYKPTSLTHPCTLWAIDSLRNCEWLCQLGIALADERRYRFPHVKEHLSLEIIEKFRRYAHCDYFRNVHHISFVLAMPLEFRRLEISATERYRLYYRHKRHQWEQNGKKMTWTNRDEPEWMKS